MSSQPTAHGQNRLHSPALPSLKGVEPGRAQKSWVEGQGRPLPTSIFLTSQTLLEQKGKIGACVSGPTVQVRSGAGAGGGGGSVSPKAATVSTVSDVGLGRTVGSSLVLRLTVGDVDVPL